MNDKNNHNSHQKHQDHHDHNDHHKMMIEDFKKRFYVSIVLTLPVLALSPLIQSLLSIEFSFPGDIYVHWALSTAIFFYGGWPFLKGLASELSDKQPGMMTLIAMAITVAYGYSSAVVFGLEGKVFFWELATLIDVMLAGHWIEMRSVMSASRSLEKLAKLMPDTAHKKSGGNIEDVSIKDIQKGDVVVIKAGEKIPADGKITKGSGAVDESMLTGESEPARKKEGDQVVGGSVNGDSVLEAEVTNTGEESYINKVITLVKEAQSAKSRTQGLADKAAVWLTAIALSAGIATFVFWYVTGNDMAFSIERMATVMVIACPHALGLAIPLVSAISTSESAENGLLIRNRTAFERARNIDVVAFDKTGTLTTGTFGVSGVQIFKDEYKRNGIISLAASLESYSEHPIAAAIKKHASEQDIDTEDPEDFEVLKGKGVRGSVGGKDIQLLSISAAKELGAITDDDPDSSTGTKVVLLVDDSPVGIITLSDTIREESYDAVKKLHDAGIACWMITGDNEKTAKSVADELGLDGYYAEVLPDEKNNRIGEMQKEYKCVAMTGDGINDAPALAKADVGIAIGSGTDVAAETADIILVNSNPADVSSLILFGKKTYNKMVQNLFWATGYNVIAIPLAAGVLSGIGIMISPAVGAAIMSLSTVIVAANAKLLKFGDT